MSIAERIRNEHQELSELFGRIIDATDGAERTKLFDELMKRLDAHERAEEQTIYELLINIMDLRPLALQGLQEHKIARLALDELSKTDAGDAWFMPRLIVANNIVAMHMQIEEGNILPLLERSMDEGQRKQLEEDYEEAEQEMIEQVQP